MTNYENHLVTEFKNAYRLARIKAIRLKRIGTQEKMEKFTELFVARWDATHLTNFKEFIQYELQDDGWYLAVLNLTNADGRILTV